MYQWTATINQGFMYVFRAHSKNVQKKNIKKTKQRI